MLSVCVVHLVWAPLGVEPFQRFIESYRRHPAGRKHRLLIVFNGFPEGFEYKQYKSVLACLDFEYLVLPKPVQDIEAYFAAARISTDDDICFLNSYSVLLHDAWLTKLQMHLHESNIGLVGATGSWQSRYNWILQNNRMPRRLWTRRGRQALLAFFARQKSIKQQCKQYQPFPNPHLRTNAFMIERQRWLGLQTGSLLHKEDCYCFESGRWGLTNQILASGREALVIGGNGDAYPMARWPDSETFRFGNQANLLVADNQTSEYSAANADLRRQMIKSTWGNAAIVRQDSNYSSQSSLQ